MEHTETRPPLTPQVEAQIVAEFQALGLTATLVPVADRTEPAEFVRITWTDEEAADARKVIGRALAGDVTTLTVTQSGRGYVVLAEDIHAPQFD